MDTRKYTFRHRTEHTKFSVPNSDRAPPVDQIVDYVKHWNQRTEIPTKRIVA